MKKIWVGILIATSLMIASISGANTANAASVDNFTITEYKAEFYLSRDEEKRSTLDVTLKITADFPLNQNRGLAPIFVKQYEGHSTSFNLKSVTDEHGNPRNYHWNKGELRIGDKNKYVSGKNTYVIKYSQRDVTRFYADTNKDEFYWDVIGVEWRVPIRNVQVQIKLDESIAMEVQTDAYCYMGKSRSSERCDVQKEDATYTAKTNQLYRSEGMTMAIGFKPGTFAPYKMSLLDWWILLQIVITPIAVGVGAWLFWKALRLMGRSKELDPIVPEYIPPRNSGVTAAHFLLKKYDIGVSKGSPFAAQILDLAIRHYIKLYEVKEKTWLSPAKYEIELIKDISTLLPDEQEIIKDIFNDKGFAIGARVNLDKLSFNTAYVRRTVDDEKKANKLFQYEYGLTEVNLGHRQQVKKWAIMLAVLGACTLSIAPLVAAMMLYFTIASYSLSLTDEGVALRRYLHGLKYYIGVAEVERIRMLQSPSGAEKVQIDSSDPKQLVKLYERVLPYAVLFGQEKEWTKQLGVYYANTDSQPDWYSGRSAFTSAALLSSINNLSSASAGSYSSSTGGSSGGGSVGGGGGGGGGGGW